MFPFESWVLKMLQSIYHKWVWTKARKLMKDRHRSNKWILSCCGLERTSASQRMKSSFFPQASQNLNRENTSDLGLFTNTHINTDLEFLCSASTHPVLQAVSPAFIHTNVYFIVVFSTATVLALHFILHTGFAVCLF